MFQAREYRVLRALVFVALGLWGIVPVTHMTFLHWNTYAVRKAIVLDLCMGATYLVGWGGGGRWVPNGMHACRADNVLLDCLPGLGILLTDTICA
jgi:hypothetical protein